MPDNFQLDFGIGGTFTYEFNVTLPLFAEFTLDDAQAGEHAIGLDEHDAARLRIRRNHMLGREVAGADVFCERQVNDWETNQRF